MKFYEFMNTLAFWKGASESYIDEAFPQASAIYKELSKDQIDYLLSFKHIKEQGGLKRARVSSKVESLSSRAFIMFWLFKAFEEIGGYATEGEAEVIGLTLESSGGMFYLDLFPKERGISYESWVAYNDEFTQANKMKIKKDDTLSEEEKILRILTLTPQIKSLKGYISEEDFAFEIDDVFNTIRGQMYDFLKKVGGDV